MVPAQVTNDGDCKGSDAQMDDEVHSQHSQYIMLCKSVCLIVQRKMFQQLERLNNL